MSRALLISNFVNARSCASSAQKAHPLPKSESRATNDFIVHRVVRERNPVDINPGRQAPSLGLPRCVESS